MQHGWPGKAVNEVRGADAIVNALKLEGVEFVAGITGGSTTAIFDALHSANIRIPRLPPKNPLSSKWSLCRGRPKRLAEERRKRCC